MSYSIEITNLFEKQLKRLVKKFPSIKIEFAELVKTLKQNPEQGTCIGGSCYKIRIAIASKGKGKSGGARIISHFQIKESKVYLLSIYDKSEQSNITDKELKSWLNNLD
jgi:mRNA-degrading endonuclease RelE of RelBE toxin-antitoxin system